MGPRVDDKRNALKRIRLTEITMIYSLPPFKRFRSDVSKHAIGAGVRSLHQISLFRYAIGLGSAHLFIDSIWISIDLIDFLMKLFGCCSISWKKTIPKSNIIKSFSALIQINEIREQNRLCCKQFRDMTLNILFVQSLLLFCSVGLTQASPRVPATRFSRNELIGVTLTLEAHGTYHRTNCICNGLNDCWTDRYAGLVA